MASINLWPLGNTDNVLTLFPDHSDKLNHRDRVWLFEAITWVFHDERRQGATPELSLVSSEKTHFLSTSSMRAGKPRVCGWLWPWRRSTSCLSALSSMLRAATSFSSRQLSLSAMLIVSGSPASEDSFMESSTDSSQASRLPRAWSTFTTFIVEKQRIREFMGEIQNKFSEIFLPQLAGDLVHCENNQRWCIVQ